MRKNEDSWRGGIRTRGSLEAELRGVFGDNQEVAALPEIWRPLGSTAHASWILRSLLQPASQGVTILASVD